jgi:hypothetical protein
MVGDNVEGQSVCQETRAVVDRDSTTPHAV